jgi:glycerophosphoinositol inositolphosphodiesterase
MDLERKEKSKRIWSKIWYGFYVLYFLNMLVVTTIIVLMRPLWYDITEFIIGMIGVRINWMAIILTLIFLIFAHSLFLVIFHAVKFMKTGTTRTYVVNKIIPFIFLPVWDFALNLLISEAGEEVSVVRTQLEYLSPLIWLVLVIGISALAPIFYRRIVEKLSKIKKEVPKWHIKARFIFGTIIITVICIFPFISPFFLVPSTVIKGAIPPKPILMGHRGASHLAPENTLVSAEQALAYGAAGVEVDLTISLDGVIVLMHDDTLRRTTNVATVFPGRENDDVTSFTFAELRSLDAGSWFVDSDPFNTIKDGYVNEVTAESYRGEKIPTLEELINFTRDNGLLLDIDSKGPPSGHPYYTTYNTILLNQLNSSGMGKDILLGKPEALYLGMTYVTGPDPVEQLISMGSELVNTHHALTNKEFKAYEEAGIKVMCWTVDSISRFSQLWCLGVDYIKTNNLHLMGQLTKPVWSLNIVYYYVIWAVVVIIAPTLSFTVDYFMRKKLNHMRD